MIIVREDDKTMPDENEGKREAVNILFGPPSDPEDAERMMALFFEAEGKHIVCGGTSASIAAMWLKKPLHVSMVYEQKEIPPIGEIEGVDLVTEGVITLSRVLEYAKNHLYEKKCDDQWHFQKDGASLIARLLFEEADDIHFYIGRAVNPAHRNREVPIDFQHKMKLVEELAGALTKMGKRIRICYF